MNWTDIAVLIIILTFTIIGIKNGFLYSVFNLFSYLLSVIFAIKFYPVLSDMLSKTVVYEKIKASVIAGLIKQQAASVSGIKENTAQTVVGKLKAPNFVKEHILAGISKSNIIDTSKIIDAVGNEVATLIINILSVILIYIIIRVALIFIKVVIKTISRIPVFKQLDKTGGIVLGAIEGIFVVYVICAILVLFSAFPKFASTIDSIENSKIANYFYQNNFIVSWIAPANGSESKTPQLASQNTGLLRK